MACNSYAIQSNSYKWGRIETEGTLLWHEEEKASLNPQICACLSLAKNFYKTGWGVGRVTKKVPI